MRYYAPITVFLLAVLAPCIAMSVLALRAAEREAMYVERRMETALLAEVDLTCAGLSQLMADILESLRRSALEPEWGGNPLAGVRFTLSAGRLDLSGGSDETAAFRDNFEEFLLQGESLPTYELVTRAYRTSGIMRQREGALLETDPLAEDRIFGRAESEGFVTYPRNVAPQKTSQARSSLNASPAPTPPAPNPLAARMSGPEAGGTSRAILPESPLQDMESAQPNESPAEFEEALYDAMVDIFDSQPTFRSKTVSKRRSFSELVSEAPFGLLPNVTDYGLELLFWAKTGQGRYTGCALRMDVLRDLIADTMPDVISDARILTVLDYSGEPIVAPTLFPAAAPDWASPFVAREISPLLPRWEVGAWLTDPSSLESRANFARLFAWIQVAVLGSVILAGSVVVIRMMSYEMRIASQKTTFVANVSHELKTPLTSIRLYAELLASGRQTDEERRREYLRTMISEAERLSNLVDNVLTFSKRESGRKNIKTELISLADLTAETVSQIEPHLEKLGFSVRCAPGNSTEKSFVRGDREALKQILVNLLSNAEKYSGASREINVEFGHAGRSAVVRVMDRGIGVPPGMSEKIFHEFVRGDDSLSAPAGGAGLGLSIARDIARRHGGDVTFSPRNGGGSVFSLTLPLVIGGTGDGRQDSDSRG
ncbi:MAG: HAMP domain-containing histidine kinase [Synergistaceae bacterium]|nr:HAMP domain-containing histidine kinase [Synergistaceae bacterium]